MKLIALGSDPELFLENSEGKVISAIGKIGGTKDHPRPLKDLGRGYYVQEDNVLLEYNTPIAKSPLTFCSYQRTILDYLVNMVGQLGLHLSSKASHSMDEDQLNDPRAFVFGCEPDFNAWTVEWNKKPEAQDPALRSAGGHIHIAYENPNPAMSIKIARALDYFVGAPLAKRDPDTRRRELYGRPGAIRFKKYGLEYRTPSNFWIQHPELVKGIWPACRIAVDVSYLYDDYEEVFKTAKEFLEGNATDYDRKLDKEYGYL